MLRLDVEGLRRLAVEDPVRAGVLLRHNLGRLGELAAGDFTNIPPNVDVEGWAAELTAAVDALRAGLAEG